MKQSIAKLSLLAGAAVCGVILFSSCHQGKIPIDEKRAALHIITETRAKDYQKSYSTATEELQRQVKDSAFLDQRFKLPIAEAFNRDAIGALLNAQGADGIRIYLGRDSIGRIRLVLVPITKEGKDIYTRLIGTADVPANGVSAAPTPQPGQAVEIGQICPTLCD